MNKLVKILTLAVATAAATGATTATWADDDHDSGRSRYEEMTIARQVIKQSGITADKAIDIAKSTYKGTVYQYELEADHNRLTYKIELANPIKGEIYEVEIDASNGKIVKETIERNLSAKESAKILATVEAIQQAGFTVKDVIAKVSPAGEPMVKEVEYENRLGVGFFEVETVGASGKQKVLVDINQKSVIPGFKSQSPHKSSDSHDGHHSQ